MIITTKSKTAKVLKPTSPEFNPGVARSKPPAPESKSAAASLVQPGPSATTSRLSPKIVVAVTTESKPAFADAPVTAEFKPSFKPTT